jgi:hypothetical protein
MSNKVTGQSANILADFDLAPAHVIGASAPENVKALWIKTPEYLLYVHNGTDWVPVTTVYAENAGIADE